MKQFLIGGNGELGLLQGIVVLAILSIPFLIVGALESGLLL